MLANSITVALRCRSSTHLFPVLKPGKVLRCRTPILVLCTAQVFGRFAPAESTSKLVWLYLELGSSDTHDLRNSIRLKCGSCSDCSKQRTLYSRKCSCRDECSNMLPHDTTRARLPLYIYLKYQYWFKRVYGTFPLGVRCSHVNMSTAWR